MKAKFNVIDFREVDRNDDYDVKYMSNWSRPYEYDYVMRFLKDHNTKDMLVHNTACGGHNFVHNVFMNELSKFCNCIHSDIAVLKTMNMKYYDITRSSIDYKNYFDFVLNISTLEHLAKDKWVGAFNNLLDQIKINGYLIITFDIPLINLKEMEDYIESKCTRAAVPLYGKNSVAPDLRKGRQHGIVELIIQK